MSNNQNQLRDDLLELLNDRNNKDSIVLEFGRRIQEGKYTIQENPESHFCVYFAAYDQNTKEVFIGHHKKSGLWLFNGGHIDKGETMTETLEREINEEWGLSVKEFTINQSALLTITKIDNPVKQTCRRHYDIWYFIAVDRNDFKPIREKLLEEFYEAGWKTIKESKELVKDKNTLKGIRLVAENYF